MRFGHLRRGTRLVVHLPTSNESNLHMNFQLFIRADRYSQTTSGFLGYSIRVTKPISTAVLQAGSGSSMQLKDLEMETLETMPMYHSARKIAYVMSSV